MNHSLPTPAVVAIPPGHDFWEAAGPDETPAIVLSPLPALVPVVPKRGFVRTLAGWSASGAEWVFGLTALIVGLAVLSALPIAQFLSFGYLLEVGGRVARTKRLRSGVIGVRKAARVGGMVIGCVLLLLPLWLLAGLAASAQVIDPDGPIARRWRVFLALLTVLTVAHLALACLRGGKLRYFLWPFSNPFWLVRRLRHGGAYTAARDAVWDFVTALRLPYYFRLGSLGFLGTMAWLIVPVSLLAIGRKLPPVGIIGALMLGVVALALPFLQVRFAVENRFLALFEYRAIRQRFRRAPWAFATAFFFTSVFAIPLYLLKIEMIPRETAWLPGLVFLGFIFPTRVLTGWAYGRSIRRERPRHGFFRWTSRLWALPTAAFYVLIVFFTQFTAWQGIWSLYEQHAFLLPVPFLNM